MKSWSQHLTINKHNGSSRIIEKWRNLLQQSKIIVDYRFMYLYHCAKKRLECHQLQSSNACLPQNINSF